MRTMGFDGFQPFNRALRQNDVCAQLSQECADKPPDIAVVIDNDDIDMTETFGRHRADPIHQTGTFLVRTVVTLRLLIAEKWFRQELIIFDRGQ